MIEIILWAGRSIFYLFTVSVLVLLVIFFQWRINGIFICMLTNKKRKTLHLEKANFSTPDAVS